MKRLLRISLAALVFALGFYLGGEVIQVEAQGDVWAGLTQVWNPFAAKLNRGELDLKAWHKVLAQIYGMEWCGCPAEKGRI